MPRDYRVDDGFGAQGLDYNKPLARFEGYSVKSGCKVTINTGDLGSGNNTLSVASGTVIAGGSTVSISSQSVDIPASDSDPRKDLVVYDESDAAITVKGGTAEAAVPANATGLDTRHPSPQDLFAEDAVVLCEVWVPGGANSVGSGDLTDRRLMAESWLGALTLFGALDMGSSNNIQDAGTDVIQFDGSQNITLPGGDVTVTSGGSVILSSAASDIISHVDSSGINDAQDFVLQITDDAGTDADTIGWVRESEVPLAFQVHNFTDATDLLKVDDAGNVTIGNGTLQLGSTNTAVSTLFGDSGEYVALGNSGSGQTSSSTTSTSYTTVLGSGERGVVPADRTKPTNISTYGVSATFTMENNTSGETTSARVYDETNSTALTSTEATTTGSGLAAIHTPIEDYDPGSAWEFNIQMKVTSGTGTIEGDPGVILWGKVS